MGSINLVRVVLGGLAAGVVLNAVDFVVQGMILEQQWTEAMRSLSRPPIGGSAIAMFVVLDFLYGITIAYLYAAIRPRMGAGPSTAVCAGLMLWTVVGLFGLLGNLPLGIFPLGLLFTGVGAALPAYVVAGLVAGWLYREDEAARAS